MRKGMVPPYSDTGFFKMKRVNKYWAFGRMPKAQITHYFQDQSIDSDGRNLKAVAAYHYSTS
jgi:hypothetical protein